MSQAEAINIAGRQRMLTQRITKSYLQIGLGADADRSRRQLREAVALFESQYERLRAYAPTDEITGALHEIEPVWSEFRQVAQADTPDTRSAVRLADLDEHLLDLCEAVVYLIEDLAGDSYARLVNTAGRQRMLSQRLAKFYMMAASDLAKPSTHAQMDRVSNEFKGALHTLRSAPENSVGINEKLERVFEQWVWMESSLDMQDGAYYPLIVDDASEKILTLMDSITGMYARIDSGL